jgi:hypothetical protein
MYVPQDIHRAYAIETRTAKDQRTTDEQVGKAAAVVAALGRRLTGRTRAGGRATPHRASFRKVGVNSPC